MDSRRFHQHGFTLVELAVVLVIIGLLVGGIMVGQDMIKSSEIRATIKQWEGYNAAVNTFRDKFAYLPGDINQAKALQYGLYDRTAVASPGNGDGNGLLQACSATSAAGLLAGCETIAIWRDLNSMNLVDGNFVLAGTALAAITTANLPLYFPEAALGRGNYWVAFSADGKNWLQLTGIDSVSALGAYTLNLALSPAEAHNIDRKIDDTRPLAGSIRGLDDTAALNVPSGPAAAAAGICVENVNNTYNQATESSANTPACQLRLRLI